MSEIVSCKIVKIAKSHNCWGCKNKFPVGSEMEAVKQSNDGRMSTAYWCGTCSDFLMSLPSWERGTEWDYGDLLEYENYPKAVK
jgi:hypothetical protein